MSIQTVSKPPPTSFPGSQESVDSDGQLFLDEQEKTINLKVSGVSIQTVSKLPPMSIPGIQKSVDSDGCRFRWSGRFSGGAQQSVDSDGTVDSDGVSIQMGGYFRKNSGLSFCRRMLTIFKFPYFKDLLV